MKLVVVVVVATAPIFFITGCYVARSMQQARSRARPSGPFASVDSSRLSLCLSLFAAYIYVPSRRPPMKMPLFQVTVYGRGREREEETRTL